jgi:hypothetical protein
MANKYYWEYFRNRKDNKLNRLYSKALRLSEVEGYIKKDWLQADLTFQIDGKGTIYKIGHITTSDKMFLSFDHQSQKFIKIPLNRIEEWLDFEEISINKRKIFLR